MQLQTTNPATPARALTGSGTRISSAAIYPEHTTSFVIINRLRQRFGVTESVAALIASLAALGPEEGR